MIIYGIIDEEYKIMCIIFVGGSTVVLIDEIRFIINTILCCYTFWWFTLFYDVNFMMYCDLCMEIKS